MTILHLDTSILGGGSATREITAAIVAKLSKDDNAEVIYRDLAAQGIAHMTLATLPWDHPLSATSGDLDDIASRVRDTNQHMLEEFLAADTIVIGAPMYNFAIPTQLKAWVDYICVPGKTFAYGANGPNGLAGGKRVVVVVGRGGFYGPETVAVSTEHAESYLRTVLRFVGITDPEFILIEGLAVGEEHKTKALEDARRVVAQLRA